jgi:hypothetical protein
MEMKMREEMIEVFNVNIPGVSSRVRRDKYEEVKRVLNTYMPEMPPGLTQEEMASLVMEKVSRDVFEDAAKAPWWMKTVQLDLEEREVLVREKTRPTRWHYDKNRKEKVPSGAETRKPQKRKENEMLPEIKTMLTESGLLDSFAERPYYQRNDYLGWIYSAKMESTKAKRIKQMLEELKQGDRYMNMEYKKAGK